MLVLKRRIGEALVISNNINVSVLGVNGNQVRLGIKAPKHISVHRAEIQQRIDSEMEAGMNDREKSYKGMIQELVDEGLYDFSSVEKPRAEIIAFARYGIDDNKVELYYDATEIHCDAIAKACENGMPHEEHRLRLDGMRRIMCERYDATQRKFIKGLVQVDLDAAAEAAEFNGKIDAVSGLSKANFNGLERV